MKKLFIIALAVLALSSCAKPDKCKCKFELNSSVLDIELKDQIIARPTDKSCGQIKVVVVKGEFVSIDFSMFGSVKCGIYQD